MISQIFLLALLIATAFGQALPKYHIDPTHVYTSGISSGAYMANQLHVAYSATFKGCGSIAGGPYYCAKGSVSNALTACMTSPTLVNVDDLISAARSYASTGAIDSLSHLANSRNYIYAGSRDNTVNPQESRLLEEFYAAFVPSTHTITEYSINSGHAHITDFYGSSCTATSSPYINNCDYDQAGVLLKHMYQNNLKPRGTYNPSNLLRFDQDEFGGQSMDPTGFVYVPTACQQGALCSLHVALHGCVQNWRQSGVGTKYVEFAGYNEWAEPNNIIVLYPQTEPNSILGNPNACWDWWGYADRNYAVKAGSQMKAVFKMVERLMSGAPALSPPDGVTVTNVTDNSVSLAWRNVDGASGYYVIRDGNRINPAPIASTSYTDSRLASGTRYTYTVAAVSSSNATSLPSSPVTVTTTGIPPPLSAPSDLVADQVTSSTVNLVWEPVSGADRYLVFRDDAQVANVTVLTYKDSGLQAETTYVFSVRAQNVFGTGPAISLTVTTESAWICKETNDNNYNHVAAGRAYTRTGYVYAVGSEDFMGLYNIFTYTVLGETSEGFWQVGGC